MYLPLKPIQSKICMSIPNLKGFGKDNIIDGRILSSKRSEFAWFYSFVLSNKSTIVIPLGVNFDFVTHDAKSRDFERIIPMLGM